MSIFKKAKGAKPSEGGSYFSPGEYVVQINRLKKSETRQGAEFCAIEAQVVTADNEGRSPKVGQEASQMIMGSWDGAGQMLVAFAVAYIEATTGEKVEDTNDLDEAFFEELFGVTQPAIGIYLGLKVLPPKAGKKFQPHRWRALTKAELKAMEGGKKAASAR